ncbi:enoyl-CoA hydratase/isomerase family protein [Roseateles paludis]|uniref:Enoyl-CoA hydratase/isomerase family protein n=1 Tax=Roseateles paludis TaxID=3145238 RepID=A0ABV0FY23_9BURK
MPTCLTLDTQGPVARITLARPEVRNAFNEVLIAELTAAFAQIAAAPGLRAVVLAADGPAFCAGADLRWMQAMAAFSWDENHADASRLAEMFWVIDRCPVPVIARIQGDAYAGGVGLVACADIAVAADTAGFCLSEAKLGLLPGTIAPYVVRAMGERAARRYFTTAERFSAAEAHRLGLVHEVVTADQLDARVDELAALLCANGPAAVRACKRLVQDVAGQEITPLLRDDTARRIADIRASDEGRAGVASFLNKTPPPWR